MTSLILCPRIFAPRRVGWLSAAMLVCAGAVAGLRDPLASMADYTTALMALNQIAPPLLLAALPRPRRPGGPVRRLLLDPRVALPLFGTVCIVVNLPGIFDRGLTSALRTFPLGLLELLSGLLFWAQFMPATRPARPRWLIGVVAWIGMMPMTVVAVVWMLSSHVLYSPYLEVVCKWNVPPLVDQRWAGFLMLLSGVPARTVGLWLVLAPAPAPAPACAGGEPGRSIVAEPVRLTESANHEGMTHDDHDVRCERA